MRWRSLWRLAMWRILPRMRRFMGWWIRCRRWRRARIAPTSMERFPSTHAQQHTVWKLSVKAHCSTNRPFFRRLLRTPPSFSSPLKCSPPPVVFILSSSGSGILILAVSVSVLTLPCNLCHSSWHAALRLLRSLCLLRALASSFWQSLYQFLLFLVISAAPPTESGEDAIFNTCLPPGWSLGPKALQTFTYIYIH